MSRVIIVRVSSLVLIILLSTIYSTPRLISAVFVNRGYLVLAEVSSLVTFDQIQHGTIIPDSVRTRLQESTRIFQNASRFLKSTRAQAGIIRALVLLGDYTQTTIAAFGSPSACSEDPTCWYILGWSAWQQHDHELAAKAWQSIGTSLPVRQLAYEHENASPPRATEAEELYRIAASIWPGDVLASDDLASFYLRRGDIESAIPILAHTVELYKKPLDKALALGRLYEQEGSMEKAAASYEEACKLDAENAECFARLAGAYRATSKEKALAAWQKVVDLDPGNMWAYLAIGDLERETRRYVDAEIWYRKAQTVSPNRPEPISWLGINAQIQGRWSAAEEYFRYALKVDDNYAYAHWGLAVTLYQQGRLTEALSEYRHAVTLDPHNTDYNLALANLLLELGSKGDAAAVCRNILAWDSRNESGRECLVKAGY